MDEGHAVFSEQPNGDLAGQHVLPAKDVQCALAKACTKSCRTFIFHDSSYQCIGMDPVWPMVHEVCDQFFKQVIRMPASVRDTSVPHCLQMSDSGCMNYFHLRNQAMTGPKVKYYDSVKCGTTDAIAHCLDEIFDPAQHRMMLGQVAVLEKHGENVDIVQLARACETKEARSALSFVGYMAE